MLSTTRLNPLEDNYDPMHCFNIAHLILSKSGALATFRAMANEVERVER